MMFCVLGLGQIGLPVAEYIESKGFDVIGYDISQEAIKKAHEKGISAFLDWHDVPHAEVYIVCVGTWNKAGKPDIGPVFDISKNISSRTKKNDLVSIESTVVPGTCRKIYGSIFHGDIKLVHSPHRYWPERPVEHGVKQLRVIGGVNRDSLYSGKEVYENLLAIPLHEASSIEVAEICKISENSYRYVQIAFAEELRMICEDLGLDFKEVQEACNTKWNTEILDAREGIGGTCLPKDIHLLSSSSQYNTLLKASTRADRKYRKWLKKIPSSKHQ